jgi:PPOX class probable F420-dependent enzyme
MPPAPLPADLERFLLGPRHAVIATVRPGGSPHSAPCWYEWADGHVVVAMDADGPRARAIRRNPNVALSVLGKNWYNHVSLLGRVVELRDDPDLADIDRLSTRYLGGPYHDRDYDGVSALIEIRWWHTWGDPAKEASQAKGGSR